MDQSVGLVQTYLRVNGYFTVTEYPVILPLPGGGFRTATDLDLLAVRFPRAGHPGSEGDGGGASADPPIPDPLLQAPADQPDMLIGEVKEGRAELNAGAADPAVIGAVLVRFGCCDDDSAQAIARQLKQRGRARLPNGHPVRMVAFGSFAAPQADGTCLRLTHSHMLQFLEQYLRRYWGSLHVGELKDPILAFLALLEKAERKARRLV